MRTRFGDLSSLNTALKPRDVSQDAGSSNVSPKKTVTITQTVFVDHSVTSTMQPTSESTGESMGPSNSGSAGLLSSTTTSTVYIFRASSTSITSSVRSPAGAKPAATGSFSAPTVSTDFARHGIVATGATLGSMAFVGLVGCLLWFFCYRNKPRREKFKQNIKLETLIAAVRKPRRSNELNTPKLKNQKQDDQKLMEETRSIMLKQKSALKAIEKGNDSRANLVGAAAAPGMSGTLSLHEQYPTYKAQEPLEMPAPLSSSSRLAASNEPSSSTSTWKNTGTIPRKQRQPPTTPAPVLTTQNIRKAERSSPLSPRAMFNAVSTAVKRLSPSGSSSLGGFDALLGDDGKLKAHRSRQNSSYSDSDGGSKPKSGKWI